MPVHEADRAVPARARQHARIGRNANLRKAHALLLLNRLELLLVLVLLRASTCGCFLERHGLDHARTTAHAARLERKGSERPRDTAGDNTDLDPAVHDRGCHDVQRYGHALEQRQRDVLAPLARSKQYSEPFSNIAMSMSTCGSDEPSALPSPEEAQRRRASKRTCASCSRCATCARCSVTTTGPQGVHADHQLRQLRAPLLRHGAARRRGQGPGDPARAARQRPQGAHAAPLAEQQPL
jgi:hypothetical protein